MELYLLIFIIVISILLPIGCQLYHKNKENFEAVDKTFTQINSTSPTLNSNVYPTPGQHCVYHERYGFAPYYMENTLDLSKSNGCYSSKYWDCIAKNNANSELNNPHKIPKELSDKCKKVSNASCVFPAITSTSNNEPYIDYFNYH